MRTLRTMMSLRSGMAALHEEFAPARPVELVEEDALRMPEEELRLGDDEGEADAHEHRLDVPRRVLRRVELVVEGDAGRDQAGGGGVGGLPDPSIPEGGEREASGRVPDEP